MKSSRALLLCVMVTGLLLGGCASTFHRPPPEMPRAAPGPGDATTPDAGAMPSETDGSSGTPAGDAGTPTTRGSD